MEYGFWGALTLMVLMADPLGNIPIALACLKNVPNERKNIVLARECAIAMVMLLLAMFFGRGVLEAIGLSDAALSIGGSVIVMLIAIRMVFRRPKASSARFPGRASHRAARRPGDRGTLDLGDHHDARGFGSRSACGSGRRSSRSRAS